jgi:hypothetical protein
MGNKRENNSQRCPKCKCLLYLDPEEEVITCFNCWTRVRNRTKGHFIHKLLKMIKELEMNKDNYSEIINGEDTYREIANHLKEGKSVFIGWTDNEMTHYDILFTYKEVISEGCHQRGMRAGDLFVSIIGIGAFGFNLGEKAPGYIAEKLFHGRYDETVDKITELINKIGAQLK